VRASRRFCVGLALALGLAPVCTRPRAPRAIEVTPARLDLGVVIQNRAVQGTVELRNLGTTALRLALKASSARCRVQDPPDGLAPGAKVQLSVSCQPDLLGPLQEQLLLLDSAQDKVAATLEIIGKVEPVVGFDTSFVDLRPAFGETQSVDVHLIGQRAHEAKPTIEDTGGYAVTVAPLPADAGRHPGFRISCRGNKVGMHAGNLVVATGLAEQPTVNLSWGCRGQATLEVEPSTPLFNLHVSGDRATTITVSSTQPRFAVKSVRITEGPFTATLEKPKPDGSVPITVRMKNDEIPDDARSATGKLLIESNDSREPSKEVPLFGFGKINKVPPKP
jgi:hypothetical protein